MTQSGEHFVEEYVAYLEAAAWIIMRAFDFQGLLVIGCLEDENNKPHQIGTLAHRTEASREFLDEIAKHADSLSWQS